MPIQNAASSFIYLFIYLFILYFKLYINEGLDTIRWYIITLNVTENRFSVKFTRGIGVQDLNNESFIQWC